MDRKVHTALWMTYLYRHFRTPPKDLRKKLPDLPDIDVVDVLAKKKVNSTLLGVGLWNLLSAYGDEFPKPYTDLFEKVYGSDAAQAREDSRGKEAPVFPLDPQQIIQEPELVIAETLDGSTVRMQLVVAGDLTRFEDVVNPASWSACDLFWKSTRKPTAKEPTTVRAQLQLPDTIDKKPIDVALHAEVSRGPFEVRTDFEMAENDRIEVCRGFSLVRKEEGRPGLIRITQQRTVRFEPGFDHFRVPTVVYWLQAEIACLALPRIKPRAPLPRARPASRKRPRSKC